MLRAGGWLSKTQVDKLGDRLRTGPLSSKGLLGDAFRDLRTLDAYRISHRATYDTVVGTVRKELGLEATGRPGKSTGSILAKLGRQHVRLSQMQDIAGCRLLVADRATQDQVVSKIVAAFPGSCVVDDRRVKPSHGYRAVHVIVTLRHRSVEVQVRTKLQHQWAVSEKAADVYGNEVKYGQGPPEFMELLGQLSRLIDKSETVFPKDGKFHAELSDIMMKLARVDTLKRYQV